MLMSTSSEFVTLCQSQLALISNWGASLSVVYLTEKLTEDGKGKLIPIVAYPESPREWETARPPKSLPCSLEVGESIPRLFAREWTPRAIAPATLQSDRPPATQTQEKEEKSPKQPQIVLPLIQDEIMMGLLVSARSDRPWNPEEKAQLQQVARTLANACILEQRSQWLKEKFKEQKKLQSQQYDRMHSLMHQFKSPLTALGTFGKLLLKRLLPEDKNKEIANSIVRESDRLRELVEQIDETIDVSEQIISLPPENWQTIEPEVELAEKINSEEEIDEPKLEKTSRQHLPLLPGSDFLESVSVTEILEPLLVSGKAIAEENLLDLRTEIPASLPPVRGNKKALREVLSNLIDNAIKYTPSGGKIGIKVGYAPFPNQISIAISDTGYGIPATDLEHLFERNFRGEKANTEIPGSGLGLAIARDLIHQMQGDIEVLSPAISQYLPSNFTEKKELTNRGTTVIVWLEV